MYRRLRNLIAAVVVLILAITLGVLACTGVRHRADLLSHANCIAADTMFFRK